MLSESSLASEWISNEIGKARKLEKKTGRKRLFPIRLVPMASIDEWKCFDVDTGMDAAVEIRDYSILDFADWKDDDSFEASFQRLMETLKSEAEKGGR